jgi:hypothetical protein
MASTHTVQVDAPEAAILVKVSLPGLSILSSLQHQFSLWSGLDSGDTMECANVVICDGEIVAKGRERIE